MIFIILFTLLIAFLEAREEVLQTREKRFRKIGLHHVRNRYVNDYVTRGILLLTGSMASMIFKMSTEQLPTSQYISHGIFPAIILSMAVFWYSFGIIYNKIEHKGWYEVIKTSMIGQLFYNRPGIQWIIKSMFLTIGVTFFTKPELIYNLFI